MIKKIYLTTALIAFSSIINPSNVKHNNLNRELWQAVQCPTYTDQREIIQNLIDKGADVNHLNIEGFSLLHLATQQKSFSKVANRYEILIKNGANIEIIDQNEQTPLHIATSKCNVEVTKFLLKNGAYVDARDKNGNTPLILTIDSFNDKKSDIISLLIEHGADIEKQNSEGEKPLHRATSNKNYACILSLISHGANINSTNSKNGRTPLHKAAYKGYKECVKMLLDYGADINLTDSKGETPLHSAVSGYRYKQKTIVELLIQNGADHTIKSFNGETAASKGRRLTKQFCITYYCIGILEEICEYLESLYS